MRQAQGPVPALLSAEGVLSVEPVDVAGDEGTQVLALLQEDRAYTDDRTLLVTRSERGGRGFDVYYVTAPEELAREFEPMAQSIRNWVAQSECNAGRGNGGLCATPSFTSYVTPGPG